MNPEELVRPEILALKAYHVPESEGMVKLDAMENPYALPAEMRRELQGLLSEERDLVDQAVNATAKSPFRRASTALPAPFSITSTAWLS